MKLKFAFIGIILLASTLVNAQYKISGSVRSKKGEPLDFITIHVMAKNIVLRSALSNAKGEYDIDLSKEDSYLLTFSRIGYKKTDTLLYVNQNFRLDIVLPDEIKELNTVVVQSTMPAIKRKPNGYDFEIEKSFLSAGNTVNTILPILPGVLIDADGGITLNRSSVLMMIDNQEIKIPADQLVLYLNNIRSENIKHIEVITHPTAAYDAQGIGGIIKIVTKKKMENSYSGSVSNKYMQGVYAKNELAANIMINRNNLLVYAGLSGSLNKNFANFENLRENSQTQIRQENIINIRNKSFNYSANAGLRYNIKNNKSLLLDFIYGGNNMSVAYADMLTNHYFNNVLDTIIKSYIPQNRKTETFSTSVSYQHNTDEAGSTLKITGDYLIPTTHSYNGFYNGYFLSNNIFFDSVINDNNIDTRFDILSLKIDRHKILPKIKTNVDYGVKFANASTSVENFYRNYNSLWTIDNNLTNFLQYHENIYAGYTSVETKINKLQLIGGLRAEYTSYKIISINRISNDYFKIFPNLSMLLPLNNKNTLSWGIHWNKRISRPSYEILNPFVYKMDQYSLKEGNPYLKPSINNKISTELNIKQNYSVGISYEIEKNIFGEVQKPIGTMTLQTFGNINTKKEFDVTASANLSIKKYWMMIWQAMFYDKNYVSPDYNAENIGVLISNINIFRFSPTFDARLTTQFFTKGADRFTTFNKNFIFSSLDLNKTIGKRGFQIKGGISDIFNARGNMSLTYKYLAQTNTTLIKRDMRYAYITLVYNFKKGIALRKPELQKSNIDEEQRTK